MEVKFKKLSDKAVTPTYAYDGDAGLDLTATNIHSEVNECGQFVLVYHTDLSIEIPKGYVGLLFPRSSIAKKSLTLTNCVGVIDSNYRGEVLLKFKNTTGDSVPAVYPIGAKIAQLVIMPYPTINLVESNELSDTERGTGGYGSSDKEVNSDDQQNFEGEKNFNNSELDHAEAEVESTTSESAE